MNQAVLPYASPLYSGRRTVSLLRSTWVALSSVRWSRGSRPLSCPSPPPSADADFTVCPRIPGTRATSVATVSGLTLIAGAVPITSFLGLGSPLILLVIGALLLLYAASLFVAAARRTIDRQTGFLYATIDGAWVPFTAAGKWSVGLAALVVSAFAGLQIYGAWRAR